MKKKTGISKLVVKLLIVIFSISNFESLTVK